MMQSVLRQHLPGWQKRQVLSCLSELRKIFPGDEGVLLDCVIPEKISPAMELKNDAVVLFVHEGFFYQLENMLRNE